MKKSGITLVVVVSLLVGLLIYLLPNLYKLSSISYKKVTGTKQTESKKKIDKITLESDIVKNLVFPNLNSDIYSANTYFNNNIFTVNNLSNNDILSFAFKQIYNEYGYLTDSNMQGCASVGKTFSSKYLDFRIKNTISKSVSYNFTDFNVSDTEYAGLWKYDGVDSYNYNGNCDTNSSVLYYDLQKLVSVEGKDDNKTLYITAKVAFAKIENGEYIIYQDPTFNTPLNKGKYTNLDDLNTKLENLNTKKYQYIFKQGLCTYEAYCIDKGQWLNE